MKTRLTKIFTATMLVCAMVFTATSVQAADKPNIVFILTDNLGYGEIGGYGGGLIRGGK